MEHDVDSEHSEAFILAARSRQLVSDQQADTLRRESAQRSVTPEQVAIETGMLTPIEVEIAQAFSAPRDLAPGYELLDVLGFGALGVVYRAHQPHLKRDVAIKSIIQDRQLGKNVIARFQQEGTAIGRLQHPNIVSAYDSGSHRHRLYLVMELVPGTDLRKRIDDEGPMDVVTALSIARQTASGLANALAHNIIHRDIKPGNLILTDAPAGFDLPPGVPLVKIADFGLARLTGQAESEEATRLTVAGSALGTPMYCSPEQLTGDAVDHRADIYALGATLLSALSGQTPFQEQRISKLISAKLTGERHDIESLPDGVPAEVVDLINQMMAHDPDERIADYAQLIERIDQIQSGLADGRDRKRRSRKATGDVGHRRSKRWIAVALAVALVAIAGPALWTTLSADPQPTMQRSQFSPLFDGKSVYPWRNLGGSWTTGQDEELGYVLIGSGAASRRIPESGRSGPNVAVRVGIDLRQAEAAEVHFGFDRAQDDSSARWVVRFDRDRLVLGRKTAGDQDLRVVASYVDPPRFDGQRDPDYHYLNVELHGDRWFTFLDDQEIPFGNAKADHAAENDLIQLVAVGGEVFFSDIESVILTAKPAS